MDRSTLTSIAGTRPTGHLSPVEAEVMRIRALLKEHRFDDAVSAAARLAERVPENRDVLYALALGQRQQHRLTDALATLQDP